MRKWSCKEDPKVSVWWPDLVQPEQLLTQPDMALPSRSGLPPARELRAARQDGDSAFTTWMCCHSHPDISCYLTSALSSPFAASSRRRSSPFKNELCAWALPPPRSSGEAPAPRRPRTTGLLPRWPRTTSPARPGPGWLSTVGARSPSCLLEGVAGDRGASVPWGDLLFLLWEVSEDHRGWDTKSVGCLHFWQGRKLSSQPGLHRQPRGTEASWGWDCVPSAPGPCLPEPEELSGVSLQGKSGGVGTGMLCEGRSGDANAAGPSQGP